MSTLSPPDLFDAENRLLADAQAVFEGPGEDAEQSRRSLGLLIGSYDRLLRETRRLVRRSDREELELNRLNQQMQDLAAELEYRATYDSLTGVLNRAAVIDRAQGMLGDGGLALIVLDIDHFKLINDSFGHPIGDRVICGVVDCLKALAPAMAQVGRVGGEEFTLLLPQMEIEAAHELAEKLRAAISGHDFSLPQARVVTASFGVSCQPLGGSFDAAYRSADEALYVAKRAGRNRVVRAEMPRD
jgi:diguanylate cyclase (GGDEF)-like protein